MTQMKNSEVLRAARALLTPETWTKDAYARNKAGKRVDPGSTAAVCWCASGACEKVTRVFSEAEKALHRTAKGLGARDIYDVNDTAQSVDEVHALFDKAIAAEEAAGR